MQVEGKAWVSAWLSHNLKYRRIGNTPTLQVGLQAPPATNPEVYAVFAQGSLNTFLAHDKGVFVG